ncbi:MarR family winged helix-turn-helix transcriptional regulator [Deinococcus marmoris]|uniref:MarR-family transcriptional regulator n=1 Tax=Deinococcus marmoris TaxID=249408 RepID=A0A1U7NRC5_9DEIO|nr:MarR family winged helix-turn-helix transcriptional regulator [Deinococcus marmoris]OLV15464.1 MarR-family transcriptional regulator [Deinococcus marmoris]
MSVTTELETLGRTIKRIQYQHHRALETGLAAVGTTLAQWDALRAIARNPGASAHILAGETFQSDQAFGTLAKRLVAQELIERRPGQGRRIEHHLTPAGRHMLDAGFPIADGVMTASFARLSGEERAALLTLLSRMATPDMA